MACLAERRGSLAAMTEALRALDARGLARVGEAVASLAPVEDCASVATLEDRPPPPADPERARAVTEVRARVDRLEARQQLGRYAPMDELTAVVEAATETGHPPLIAQAHWLVSEASMFLHDAGRAEPALLQMARFAAEARDDRQLARAMGRLAMVLEFQDKSTQALAMSEAAEVVAVRAGQNDLATYARLTTGGVLQTLGRLDESRTAFSEALAAVERPGAFSEQGHLVLPLAHVAAAATVSGDFDQARALLDRALAIAQASLGPDHPRTLMLFRTTAVAAEGQGKVHEALSLGQRGLALLESSGRRADPEAVLQMTDNAGYLRQLGDFPAAERLYEEALTLAERSGSPRTIPQILRGLGDVRLHQGRLEEAETIYRRALAVTPSPGGLGGVGGHARLGRLFERQGRLPEARDHLRRALELRTQATGERHPHRGALLTAVAAVEALAGRCSEARPLATLALSILETTLGKDHPQLGEPLTVLGRCALDDRRPGEAAPLLERAVAILESARLAPELAGRPRALLARALSELDPSDPRAAREVARADEELRHGEHDTLRELQELRRWWAPRRSQR
jgi:tetratricopeptide (TPR) repeat protein